MVVTLRRNGTIWYNVGDANLCPDNLCFYSFNEECNTVSNSICSEVSEIVTFIVIQISLFLFLHFLPIHSTANAVT